MYPKSPKSEPFLATIGKFQITPTQARNGVDCFADPDAEDQEWQDAKSVEIGHGRLEVRAMWTSTQMNAWFEIEWAGVAQVFRLPRDVKDGAHEREEIVYRVTHKRRRESERLWPARLPTSSLACRKSLTFPSRCQLRRRCLPGPDDPCSPGFGCPQWRSPRFDGLAPRSQGGFPNAALLRASRRSLAATVSQAFAVERVHQKALGGQGRTLAEMSDLW